MSENKTIQPFGIPVVEAEWVPENVVFLTDGTPEGSNVMPIKNVPKIIKKDTSQVDDDLRRLIMSLRSRLKRKTPSERQAIVQTILS